MCVLTKHTIFPGFYTGRQGKEFLKWVAHTFGHCKPKSQIFTSISWGLRYGFSATQSSQLLQRLPLYWPGSPVPLHSIICRQAGEVSAVPWRPILVPPLGLKLNQSVSFAQMRWRLLLLFLLLQCGKAALQSLGFCQSGTFCLFWSRVPKASPSWGKRWR